MPSRTESSTSGASFSGATAEGGVILVLEAVQAMWRKELGIEVAIGHEAANVGDADLLTLTPFENIPILRPAEFLARL